jgi:hypothetical protein
VSQPLLREVLLETCTGKFQLEGAMSHPETWFIAVPKVETICMSEKVPQFAAQPITSRFSVT